MLRAIAVCLAALAATPSLAQDLTLVRADGSTLHYALELPAGAPAGIIVLAQGSGCLPTALGDNLATVRAAFPRHIAVRVEKYGIAPDSPVVDGFADCPAAFHAGHTVSQRVADYEAVLATLDPALPVTLFGGSEGGLVVAVLAGRIEAHAAILLSSATGIDFEDMVLSTVPPEGQETVKAGLAAARADPEGVALFAGSSHRFWADILDRVAADHMLASATPFLVIQGGRDESSPVAAARATTDRFAAAGRCNLAYWEFPVLDHGMRDPAGTNHLPEVAAAAAAWAAAPVPVC